MLTKRLLSAVLGSGGTARGAAGLSIGAFALVGGLCVPMFASSEEVLYREVFPSASGTGQPLSSVGWALHLGPEGWDQRDNAATAGLVNEKRGMPADGGPVASGGEPDSGHGFVVQALGPDGTDDNDYWNQLSHYLTQEWVTDVAAGGLTAFTFDLATSQPDVVRVTAKVDGRWFASVGTAKVQPTPGYGVYEFSSVGRPCRIDVSGRAWLPMSFVPKVTMGLDTSATAMELPAGRLEAVGLLLKPTGFEAFDNYTVLGSPALEEPQ